MIAKEKSAEQYTKYEIARIIGARALQISMNAPILISLKKEELEKMNYDSLKIAAAEFKSGILPITVKRPYPVLKVIEEEVKVEEVEVPLEEKKDEMPPAGLAEEPEEDTEGEEEKTKED